MILSSFKVRKGKKKKGKKKGNLFLFFFFKTWKFNQLQNSKICKISINLFLKKVSQELVNKKITTRNLKLNNKIIKN